MSKDEWLALGFALLVLGAIGDALTTIYTLDIYGAGIEGNPFVREVIIPHGTWLIFVGKALVLLLFIWAYVYLGKEHRTDPFIIGITWLGAIWWIGLAISNINQAGLL